MEDRKKILYLVTKSVWGGAQRYVYDLATHLPKQRYAVAVATGGSGPLIEKLDRAHVRTFIIPSLTRDIHVFKEIRVLFELIRLIRNAKPDVLHVNSSKTGGLGAFVGWLLRIPTVVFTAHGWPFKEERPWWQKVLITFFSWLTVFFTDVTIVVSDDDYRRGLSMPLVHKKIVRIYNGIEEPAFLTQKSSKMALQRHFKAPSHMNTTTVWVGTISELTHNKGLEHLIAACALLKERGKNFICLIIGSGELETELAKHIKESGLGENVFLLGFIPDAATLLPGLDILTLTSLKEGFPYVLLEAGLAGKAVVAARVGGIPEIVTNGLSGILVAPKRQEDIARALEEFIDNKKKRVSFGTTLKGIVQEQFSLSTLIKATEAVYDY